MSLKITVVLLLASVPAYAQMGPCDDPALHNILASFSMNAASCKGMAPFAGISEDEVVRRIRVDYARKSCEAKMGTAQGQDMCKLQYPGGLGLN